jgi:hypothetical protein
MEPIGCTEMLVTNYHFKPQISQKSADLEEKNTSTQLSLPDCQQFKLLTWYEMSQICACGRSKWSDSSGITYLGIVVFLHGLITGVFPFSLSFHIAHYKNLKWPSYCVYKCKWEGVLGFAFIDDSLDKWLRRSTKILRQEETWAEGHRTAKGYDNVANIRAKTVAYTAEFCQNTLAVLYQARAMIGGRNRAVGIATDYGMDCPGSKPFFLIRPDWPRDPPTRCTRCLYCSLSYYSVWPFETFKISLKRFLYHHSFYSIEEYYEYNDDKSR